MARRQSPYIRCGYSGSVLLVLTLAGRQSRAGSLDTADRGDRKGSGPPHRCGRAGVVAPLAGTQPDRAQR